MKVLNSYMRDRFIVVTMYFKNALLQRKKEFQQQLLRLWKILVLCYFPQHSVLLVQKLYYTTICHKKVTLANVFPKLLFPDIKQKTPSTVYL